MTVALSALLSEIPEKTRNSTTGALDNTKRTRAINRVLEDLQDFGDWNFTIRSKTKTLTEGTFSYSLLTDFVCTCYDNDGTATLTDFKNPKSLRPTTADYYAKPFMLRDIETVRQNIRENKALNEYAIQGDEILINHGLPTGTSVTLEYYSLAMVQKTNNDYQLEFNPDAVTQTDKLLGGVIARRCVVQGASYELFEIIGGKSERDRTDSFKIYQTKKVELLKKCGHRLRRQGKVLNFQSR